MKVIILSAGQGTRLLPLTADRPKCLIPVQGKTVLEWQIDELHRAGIDNITVVVGYNAPMVEALLADRYGPGRVRTRCNADYASTDNLVSCWLVRMEVFAYQWGSPVFMCVFALAGAGAWKGIEYMRRTK